MAKPRHCSTCRTNTESIRHHLEEGIIPKAAIEHRLVSQHRKRNRRPEWVIMADPEFYHYLTASYASITNAEAIERFNCNDLRSVIRSLKINLIRENTPYFIAKAEVPGEMGLVRYFLVATSYEPDSEPSVETSE